MGRIDYINASPVYYGLDNGLLPEWIKMTDGPPSVLNSMIRNKELDISPVSAAFYGMNHNRLLVLPDLSISCHGKVLSVVLMSNLPIEELDGGNVVLTRDSATAVSLVKLVFSKQGVVPRFFTTRVRTLDDIPEGTDAALVIGDAALTQPWDSVFNHRIDLGDLWYQMTGLPFVFALWVVRKSVAGKVPWDVRTALKLFYESRTVGYANLEKIISCGSARLNLDKSLIRKYYDSLYCDLDEQKIIAVETFFASLYTQGLFPDKVSLEFFT